MSWSTRDFFFFLRIKLEELKAGFKANENTDTRTSSKWRTMVSTILEAADNIFEVNIWSEYPGG